MWRCCMDIQYLPYIGTAFYHLEQLLDHCQLAACIVEWPMFDRLCVEPYSLILRISMVDAKQRYPNTYRGSEDSSRVWCASRTSYASV